MHIHSDKSAVQMEINDVYLFIITSLFMLQAGMFYKYHELANITNPTNFKESMTSMKTYANIGPTWQQLAILLVDVQCIHVL